ncbi:putative quinol monooxygenase [Candidiatus Paracoxiella cheracis]|uniref:putative quinol monooxygenase n=1 Tax=Candidiatus Paracoxiella cheracis TaxID=3405120 RepID=UPI003BF5C2EA
MTAERDMPIYYLSYFTAKPNCTDELISALMKLINPTRSEDGCLLYELAIDKSNQRVLIMIEKFINAEALAIHAEQSYIKNFMENVMDKLCEKVAWHEVNLIS